MPNSDPAWIRTVQVAVTVNNNVILPTPETESAAGKAGQYIGTNTAYQTVASWTVSTGKVGELKEILFLSNHYDKTLLKITIAGIVWAVGWPPTNSMPLIFEDCRLAAGAIVLVECKSSDGTSITVDTVIVGKEIG